MTLVVTRARGAVPAAVLVLLAGLIFPRPALPDAVEGRQQAVPSQALPDKALHGIAGASAGFLAAALTAACVTDPVPGGAAGAAAAAAVGSAALLGLAKEVLDLTGAGDPELKDWLCTIVGGAAAAAASYALVHNRSLTGDPAEAAPPLACLGIFLAVPVADAWFGSPRRDGRRRAGRNPARTVVP